MENGKRRSGLEGVAATYMSPDCGSMMYISWHASKQSSVRSGSWSMWRVRTSGASDEGGETVMLEEEENDDMDQRVCPVVRLRAWNLPSTEATRTISSNSEDTSGSGACLVGPDGLFLFQRRGGGRKFTSSAQHDEARRRASATAVRECRCVIWDGTFGVGV
jgi:hypothetical protein